VSDCLDDKTLKDLADGKLAPPQRDAGEAHLAGCERCRARMSAWAVLVSPSTEDGAATFVPSRPGSSGPRLETRDRVGPYLLEETLGRGGMGVVWRARDPRLDRWVALKVLRADAAAGSDGKVRMLREAQAMARLSHPNVVAVHDVGELGDGVFVAMELVEGTDLAQWLFERHPAWRELLPLFAAAGRGLAAAHAADLVHRDFKPANVLVGKDGRVRVTDFGLARAEGAEGMAPLAGPTPAPAPGRSSLATPLTLAGSLMGTPPFMAPEQLEGRAVGARADQFSFCAALWQALYGELPYGDGTPIEIRRSIARGPPRTPADRRGVPTWLEAAARRGLEERPEDRWPSMAQLVTVLERGLKRRRRIAIAAAVLAAAAAWTGGILFATRGPGGACATPVPDPWSPAVREAVRASFTASGAATSVDAFAAADRIFGGLARGIREEHQRACAPRRSGGPGSDEERLLRLACLDRTAEEASALAAVLRTADAGVVNRTATAVSALAPPSDCAQAKLLLAAPRLPSDPAERERYLEARRRFGEGHALLELGRKPEAAAAFSKLLPLARAGRWRALEGRILLDLAESSIATKDRASVEPLLREAKLAALAGGDDRLAVRVAIYAAFFVGAVSARPADARAWVEEAEAILERLGDDEEGRRRLLYVRATLERVTGSGERAIELAKEVVKRAPNPAHPTDRRSIDAMYLLATIYEDQGKGEEELIWAQKSLDAAVEFYGPSHPETATCYDMIAGELANEQRFSEARLASDKALAIHLATVGERSRYAASTLVTAAIIAEGQGDSQALAAYARRAVAAFDATIGLDLAETAQAQIFLAQALCSEGKPSEGEAMARRALALVEKTSGIEHAWVADGLTVLAGCLRTEKRWKETVALETRVVDLRVAEDNPLMTAGARFHLGRTLWDSGTDRARGRRLVEQALAALVPPVFKAKEGEVGLRTDIEGWLGAHPAPR
jgi:tetratricopeptide (TPR) repeat protein